jgi:hypothetical protein
VAHAAPKWLRPVVSPAARKHGTALVVGLAMMLFGTGLVLGYYANWVPHIIREMIGQGLHGLGLVPWIHHLAPLCRLVAAD